MNWKKSERNSCGLFKYTILGFTWKKWEKP